MPENTYTVKVDTAQSLQDVNKLIEAIEKLLTAIGQLSQAQQGGLINNPSAIDALTGVSKAQTGGGGAPGVSPAGSPMLPTSVAPGAAVPPSIPATGSASGTVNPLGVTQASSGAAGPTGLPPVGSTKTATTAKGPASYSDIQAAHASAQAAFAADPSQDNQYALAMAQQQLDRANKAMNPAGPAAAKGFDWIGSSFARTGAAFMGGQFVVSQATGWMDIASQQTLRGGYDWVGRGRQAGEGIGTVIGAGIGTLIAPGVGTIVGGMFGGQLGGGAGAWANAGAQAADDTFAAMAGTSTVIGRPGYGRFSGMAGWIKQIGQAHIRPSAATLGGIWSEMGEGMYNAGINPWQAVSSGFARVPTIPVGRNPSLIGTTVDVAYNSVASMMNIPDSLASRLTRIIGVQYGTEASKQIGQEQAHIIGQTPETGGNIIDIMSRFGPSAAARSLKMWAALGASTAEGMMKAEPSINPWLLSNASAGSREAMRAARIGATLGRGSGAAVFEALGAEMNAYAQLPGGAESEAYATAHARRREARMAAYGQQDIENYGIPATRLATQRGVLDALPYAPGYRFGIELQSIALNRRQAGVIQQRLQRGDLTEQQQMALEEQLSGLQISSARSVATLTEHVADRLPALSAGRPTRFSRLDATQLAAMNLGRMGHPGREFGAVNGGQLAAQNEFVEIQILGPGGERMIGPMGKDLPVGTARVEALLERIAQILQQNGGAGAGPRTRVGEAVNKGQAIATGNPAPSYGNGGYN